MENKVLKPKIRFKGFTDTWEQRKLEGIYKFQYGEFNNNPSNGGIYPVYGANGIIGGYTNYNAENSVIIGHMGEYAGSVLWGNGKHFVTYNGTISKPRGENVVSKFGYYMLYQKDINKICGGSGLPFLSYEQLNKIEVCYPKDIKEQKSIANYLTNIDNLITLHQSKYDKLVNVKKALLEKMFPKDGKNVPEIRFKGFTDTWEQRKLNEVISEYKETVDSGCDLPILTSSKSEGVVLQEEHFGRIQNHDITGYNILPLNYCTYRNRSDGVDFTFNINKRCNKGIISKFYPVFTGKNSDIFFISLELNHSKEIIHEISYTCTGTGQKVLSFLDLQKMNIKIPSYNEQHKIGQLFEKIDNLITLHQHKLEKLKNMKKSLLNKMFI